MLSRNISNRKSKKDEKKMLTHGPSIPTPINSSYSPYSGNVAKRGAYEDTYVSFYSRVAPRVYCKPNRFVSRLNWGCTRERERATLNNTGLVHFPSRVLVYKFTRGRKRILLNELGEIMTGINSTNGCIVFLLPRHSKLAPPVCNQRVPSSLNNYERGSNSTTLNFLFNLRI